MKARRATRLRQYFHENWVPMIRDYRGISNLTDKEHQLAIMVSQGLTNREIADSLNLSVHTVRNEAINLISKMNAKNRTHIAFIVRQNNLRYAS